MAAWKKSRKRAAAGLALAALATTVTFGALAQADTTVGDGDGDTPVSAALNPLNFSTDHGTLCVGQTYTEEILVAIKRTDLATDAARTFANSANLTVSFQATVENPAAADVTESISDSQIVLPSNWLSQPLNTMSDTLQGEPVGTAQIDVTVTPSAPTVGQVETTLQYRAVGPNAVTGTNITRNANTKVQWTAANCDSDPPDVTHSVGTPSYTDGGNQYVTSASTLDFDVDETTNGNSLPLSSCTVSVNGPTTNDGSFTCAEGNNNYTLSTSAPLSLGSAPPDGSYANSASAKDSFNNEGTDSFTVILDNTAPTFGSCTGGPYTLGSGGGSQAVSITASDAGSGVDNANSTLSGTVDTTTVGTKTVNYTAKDNLGNTANTSCDYQVEYAFAGFFAPVDNPTTFNVVKAGQGIPAKFSLGGNQGLDIFATDYPKSTQVNCPSQTGITDTLESTVTAGASSLSYDAIAGQYVYVWKSLKTWAGTCRRLDVKLDDGTTHSANFWFTK